MALTPREEQELASLEKEVGHLAPLSPAETDELATLEKEVGHLVPASARAAAPASAPRPVKETRSPAVRAFGLATDPVPLPVSLAPEMPPFPGRRISTTAGAISPIDRTPLDEQLAAARERLATPITATGPETAGQAFGRGMTNLARSAADLVVGVPESLVAIPQMLKEEWDRPQAPRIADPVKDVLGSLPGQVAKKMILDPAIRAGENIGNLGWEAVIQDPLEIPKALLPALGPALGRRLRRESILSPLPPEVPTGVIPEIDRINQLGSRLGEIQGTRERIVSAAAETQPRVQGALEAEALSPAARAGRQRQFQERIGAQERFRTPEALLSDIEGGLRERTLAEIPRAAPGLPPPGALRPQFEATRRIGGLAEPMPAGAPMRQVVETRGLPPVPPTDLPFGMPPLRPVRPARVSQTLEAQGAREALASPEARLGRQGARTETPPPVAPVAPVGPPGEPLPPPRAPARAGAEPLVSEPSQPSGRSVGADLIPDIVLESPIILQPPKGYLEDLRTRYGGAAAEGNWNRRSGLTLLRSEAEYIRDVLRETVPQKAFGASLDELRGEYIPWGKKNPIARKIVMDLREGVPLGAEESAFYEANRAKIDRWTNGVEAVLNRADEMQIAGGSLGPTYHPYRVGGKVGALLQTGMGQRVAEMQKWSHLDWRRTMKQRPAGMDPFEVIPDYIDDLVDAIPRKQEQATILKLRNQAAKDRDVVTFERLNDWMKKDEMTVADRRIQDLALQPYRQTPVRVGEEIASSGNLAQPGVYKVLEEVRAGEGVKYRVEVNGKADPVLYSKDDLNAIRFQDVDLSPSWAARFDQGSRKILSHWLLSWYLPSAIRSVIGNVPRVAAYVDVRDWGTAAKAAGQYLTGTATKEQRALWTRTRAVAENTTAVDLLKEGKTLYEKIAFAGLVIPDKMARVAILESSLARQKRLFPNKSMAQVEAHAKMEMGVASDIAGSVFNSPGGQEGVIAGLKFLQGSSIRTAEQAWDVIWSANVPAMAKATVTAMAVAYPTMKAMGGTWEDLQRLIVGMIPFSGVWSGRQSLGSLGMMAEMIGKGFTSAKYVAETGEMPPLGDIPLPTALGRGIKAYQTGNIRHVLPVRTRREEQTFDELAARRIKSRLKGAERRLPSEEL